MATINVSLPSDGTTADVADYNTPITTIVNEINGALDNANIAAAAGIAGSKLADGGITNAKLSTATGEPGAAWQTWSPTYANITVGNGTVVAKYIQVGKTVHFNWQLICGTTTSIANANTVSIPVAANSRYGTANVSTSIGRVVFNDVGTATHIGEAVLIASTSGITNLWYATVTTSTSNFPATEASGDVYTISGTYEAA